MTRKFYHTQESRSKLLESPVKCVRDDAWLGEAFYFWLEHIDAKKWGFNSKKRTEYFEIYSGDIDCENVLDTVFNEKEYNFWLEQIEKVATLEVKKNRKKPTLKELNDYFKKRATWNEVTGILFQDMPSNNSQSLIEPILYNNNRQVYFVYRKRIQLAVYDSNIISNFALLDKIKH